MKWWPGELYLRPLSDSAADLFSSDLLFFNSSLKTHTQVLSSKSYDWSLKYKYILNNFYFVIQNAGSWYMFLKAFEMVLNIALIYPN